MIKDENHDWKQYPIITAGMLVGKKYYCPLCGEEVMGFKDRLSSKEFKVSGLCQKCQDRVWSDDKDE